MNNNSVCCIGCCKALCSSQRWKGRRRRTARENHLMIDSHRYVHDAWSFQLLQSLLLLHSLGSLLQCQCALHLLFWRAANHGGSNKLTISHYRCVIIKLGPDCLTTLIYIRAQPLLSLGTATYDRQCNQSSSDKHWERKKSFRSLHHSFKMNERPLRPIANGR